MGESAKNHYDGRSLWDHLFQECGFSASVVYSILNRLVYALESLVRGNPRELIALQEQEARARFAEELAQSRLKTASRLMELQRLLTPDATPEEVHEAVSRMIEDEGLLPFGSYEDYVKKREDADLAKSGAAEEFELPGEDVGGSS